MFQFPALASHLVGKYIVKILGCPIRKFLDQRLFASPQDLSQLITSFIASESQGIRHVPFPTFFIINTLTYVSKFCAGDIYFQLVLKNITFCFVQYVIDRFIVENNGFEPLTPCVQGRCSSQLS